jgi:molybdate transport system ATP-binding protein
MADALTVNIEKRFPNGVTIAADLRVSMPPGTILVLFGPSGSGKTTIVRSIAGLERPERGIIVFNGETWLDAGTPVFVEPQGRRVGYVFQEAALFPHLTVLGNVRYGDRTPDLKVGPIYAPVGPSFSSGEDKVRFYDSLDAVDPVNSLLEMLDLGDLATRYPRQLSGGQAQRVALARALAATPRLLLLDEPFAALDTPARASLRRLLRSSIERLGIAAVLVTHDRTEAIALGDQMAVLAGGRIRQVGPVLDVFRRPADLIVARSVGVESVVPATIERIEGGLLDLRVGDTVLRAVETDVDSQTRDVFACIRAEDVTIERAATPAASARNHLPGRIVGIESEGPIERLTLDCGFPLAALITHQAREELALQVGTPVTAAIKATAIHVIARS